MRDEILDFLKENRDQFVSGQAMSEACHVSRTAIWKHIEVLRKRGYVIESFTKRGYRLLEEPNLVSPEEMEGVLQTKSFGNSFKQGVKMIPHSAHLMTISLIRLYFFSSFQCSPHSFFSSFSHHQRPARISSPSFIGRVIGWSPILT